MFYKRFFKRLIDFIASFFGILLISPLLLLVIFLWPIAPENVIIDFYGPVANKDEIFFFEKVSALKNDNYLGKLEPKEVQKVLSQYDVLLFPTRYPGEGCPGAIIDSYMAGLTVLASNWKYNKVKR